MDGDAAALMLAPWLQPFDHPGATYIHRDEPAGWVARHMNDLAEQWGQLARFVHSTDSLGALDYERCVSTGVVPTRDCAHDWYNALVWLRYPSFKQALNARHMEEAGKPTGANGRNRCRDALTLFDENGMLLLMRNEALIEAFQAYDWTRLLCEFRPWWMSEVQVVLVGHGLLEALHRPYKGLCAKVRCVLLQGDADGPLNTDACLAGEVMALRTPTELLPLPVMGIPGWFEESNAPDFYADARVFRPKPTRRLESPG